MFARRKGVREGKLHFVRFLWPRLLVWSFVIARTSGETLGSLLKLWA